MLYGRPLLAYTLQQAADAAIFDTIAVSSDDDEILHLARQYGTDICIERPPELATDDAAKIPAIQHAVQTAEERCGSRHDTVVDLDASAPLRRAEDIRGAIDLLESSGAPNIITGTPARRSPYFNLVEREADGTVRLSKPPDEQIVRRQDTPPCFDMNASIYVWKRSALFESEDLFKDQTRLFEMEEHQAYDIDSELDLQIVEFLLRVYFSDQLPDSAGSSS